MFFNINVLKLHTGKYYTLYQLCESYRLDGRIRHHVIVGLGKLEEQLDSVEAIKSLGKRIEEKTDRTIAYPFHGRQKDRRPCQSFLRKDKKRETV